ncbi:MAG: prolipoprotein diacylglyceryl transferase [Myxococcota bacterium]|nr:prolipoprotein diacylglyceryl transferase [Myxococcota bacterium]
MASLRLSRCARPEVGTWSTYTVLGFVGYLAASILVGLLAAREALPLSERLVVLLVPPIALVVVVRVTSWYRRRERIVFYHVTASAVLGAMLVGGVLGLRTLVIADLVVIGVALFLAFGRLGCFHVACCYGRIATWGVRYRDAHARQGLPRRLVGRTLLPVQLVEACASALLAIAGVLVMDRGAGTATVVFVIGYAHVRFLLELARGDGGRPYYGGLSEAQWVAATSAVIAAAWARTGAGLVAAGVLASAAGVIALRQRRPGARLRTPQHLEELAQVHSTLSTLREGATVTTSAGLQVSVHRLPDQRLDLLWSHPALVLDDARSLAHQLYERVEIVPARSAGMVHVLIAPRDLAA